MYNEIYEILCLITSLIIIVTSICIIIIDERHILIFVTLSGIISFLTRLYRIIKKEYITDHPLVYTDIFFAILAFGSFIYDPLDIHIYYLIIFAFFLMIIAAIMSWNIFQFNLVQESFYLQLTGHILISYSLLYYVLFLL